MKKVLITGASGGIGLEVARLMAAKKLPNHTCREKCRQTG